MGIIALLAQEEKKTCTKEILLWQLRRCIDVKTQIKYAEEYKGDKKEKAVSKKIVSADSIRFDDQ